MSEQLDKLRKLTSRTWLNSGNSSAIVNESKDDEPGFWKVHGETLKVVQKVL